MVVDPVARGPVDTREVDLKRRVHLRLLADPAVSGARVGGAPSADGVRGVLADLLRAEAPLLPTAPFERLLADLVDEVAGLGPLEPLFADPRVSEVMINGPGRVFVERAGRLERVAIDLDARAILHLVERVIGPLGQRLDRASPVVDARLPDGSRLHAVAPPLALDGPCVTIRRFGAGRLELGDFGAGPGAAAFLRWAVASGANVVVSGGTAAGKTTLCNTLAAAVPADARVVTIEETAELQLPLSHVVRLESRLPNAEGAGGVSVRSLVRAALRMRPDRLILGEVRGPEAFDLLQALNTGHDGSLTTVHANDARSVPDRLVSLVLTAGVGLPIAVAATQLAQAVDLVVHVTRREGVRRIDTVAEIVGVRGGAGVRPLFQRGGHGLIPVARPERAPRRPDAEPWSEEWFAC